MTDLRAAIAVTLVPYSDSSLPPTHGDVLDHGRAGKWIVTSVAAAERAAGPTCDGCGKPVRPLLCGHCAPEPHTVDCIGLALDLEARARTVESQTTQRAMEAAARGLRLLAPPAQAEPQPEEGDGK